MRTWASGAEGVPAPAQPTPAVTPGPLSCSVSPLPNEATRPVGSRPAPLYRGQTCLRSAKLHRERGQRLTAKDSWSHQVGPQGSSVSQGPPHPPARGFVTSGGPFFLLVTLENESPSRFPRSVRPRPGQLGRAELPSLHPGPGDHRHPCSLGGPGLSPVLTKAQELQRAAS